MCIFIVHSKIYRESPSQLLPFAGDVLMTFLCHFFLLSIIHPPLIKSEYHSDEEAEDSCLQGW